ncbi:MAG: hypothetical protein WD069_17580 [Planctomycetales bacterium]
MAASVPVWAGLVLAFWLRWSSPTLIATLGLTLMIPLAVLAVRFRWTKCPSCGRKVRIPWSSSEYARGGMLRYTCDHCRIVWSAHVFSDSKHAGT